MISPNSLEDALSVWDGKSAEDIKAIYLKHKNDKLTGNILACLPRHTRGASWLLKHHLEAGAHLHESEIEKVYAFCSNDTDWESRLHILQSIPYMPIPKKLAKSIEMFIRQGLSDKNKFVRAWSYNALNELLAIKPDLKAEVESIFAMAMRDEAPSVKARIRNIVLKL